ncbi:hypothetical protein [Bacillus atrophaeus]|nr:hypothetical protein [Bacillus atrophaeus]
MSYHKKLLEQMLKAIEDGVELMVGE